jgi:hypothetical protein
VAPTVHAFQEDLDQIMKTIGDRKEATADFAAYGEEQWFIREEMGRDVDAWDRSREEGWFYDD